jgi:hypothetical protein
MLCPEVFSKRLAYNKIQKFLNSFLSFILFDFVDDDDDDDGV